VSGGKNVLIERGTIQNINRGHARQKGLNNCEIGPDGKWYFKSTYQANKIARVDGLIMQDIIGDNNACQVVWLDPANKNVQLINISGKNNHGVGMRKKADGTGWETIPGFEKFRPKTDSTGKITGYGGPNNWEGCVILSELGVGGLSIVGGTHEGNSGNAIVIAENEDLKGGVASTVTGVTFIALPKYNNGDNNNLALRDMGKRVIKGYKADGSDQPMRLYGVRVNKCNFIDGAKCKSAGDGWGDDKFEDRNVVVAA